MSRFCLTFSPLVPFPPTLCPDRQCSAVTGRAGLWEATQKKQLPVSVGTNIRPKTQETFRRCNFRREGKGKARDGKLPSIASCSIRIPVSLPGSHSLYPDQLTKPTSSFAEKPRSLRMGDKSRKMEPKGGGKKCRKNWGRKTHTHTPAQT